MEEPKKIVLILGNGFDIDRGFKTSYKDYWLSGHCPKDYPAPIIKHLNERWGDDIGSVRWYDLENELFNYYMKYKGKINHDVITDKEIAFLKIVKPELWQFGTYYSYLNEAYSLNNKGYLLFKSNEKEIEIPYHEDMLKSYIWRDKEALNRIKKGLCGYLVSLNQSLANKRSVATYVYYTLLKARDKNDILDIYSFNYTKNPYEGNEYNIETVHYVHGDCFKGKIIVGTRDYGDFNKDYDFLQKSFDANYSPPDIVASLKDADDVIIFGHSLGENDRQYFKAFFKQQTDYTYHKLKNITLFTYDNDSEMEIKRALQKMTDNNLSALCSMNHVHIFKTVCINEDAKAFREFLSRYTTDKNDIMDTMNKLGM